MYRTLKNYKYYTSLVTLLLMVLTRQHITAQPDAGSRTLAARDEWIVVIDAGHGGKDPGSVGRVSHEKDIALAIALKTGKYITDLVDNVRVIYTRDRDEFIELYRRAEIANKARADLFISIHCNGISDSRVRGSETFAMGIHKDAGNLEVAMAENSVITLEDDYSTRYQGYDPNSSESFIAFSLMQNIYLEQSLYFASFVQNQFRERVGLRDRGVKQAGFLVLWQTTMPSVLVEAGFISNAEEERFLNTEQGQDYIASAIFRAFRDYKIAIDHKSDFSAVRSSVSVQDKAPLNEVDFRVQVATATSRTEPIPENFSGLKEISELAAGKYFKYSSGHFNSYNEAAAYREKVQEKYPDAFVIAVMEGKIIPLQEAIELTKRR